MSIRTRLTLLLAVIVVLAMLLAGVGTAVATAGSVQSSLDRTLTRQLTELKDNARSRQILDTIAQSPDRRPPGARGLGRDQQEQILFSDGRVIVLGQSDGLPVDDTDFEIIKTRGKSRIRSVELDSGSGRMITGQVNLNGESAAIQIARTNDDLNTFRQTIFRTTLLSAALASLLAALGGWLFSRRLTAPIAELTATTERVSSTQDLTERITVTGTDEVSRLGTSFNSMLDALDSSRRQQRQLVQDANHELRTPLTSLRTNIELLQRNADMDSDIRDQIMNDVGTELEELTLLVEDLVASATDLSQQTHRETFDLVDLVHDVANRAERRSHRDISVRVEDDDGSSGASLVTASRTHVERAVTNLVNNAIKFGPEATRIQVTVGGNAVSVDDDGPGIGVDDREQVFARFYRSTEARSVPGSGLGLAMVKEVAEAHGGRYWATDSPLGGAQVGFSLGPQES